MTVKQIPVHMPALLVLLALFFLLPALSGIAASDVVAVAALVEGKVEAVSESGERRTVLIGGQLRVGDTVETFENARAVFALSDGSRLDLSESTVLEVNDVLPEEDSTSSFSLFLGRISIIALEMRGDDVVITPNLTCGIRGTQFTVGVAEDGSSVVSVQEGEVAVYSPNQGDEATAVPVSPGQEIAAEQAGEVLAARPAQLADMEQWKQFSAARREKLLQNLPEIVSRLEKGVDAQLERLDALKALPMDRARVLKELREKLRGLPPDDKQARTRIIMRTHMEMAKTMGLVKNFRAQRMRLKSVFVRTRQLQQILPTVQDRLGGEYQGIAASLEAISSREAQAQEQLRDLAQNFRQAMAPIQDDFQRYKQSLDQSCPQ